MKLLMIVESPVKAKTIAGYLKDETDEWTVMATGGHIVNLPKDEHGVIQKDAKFQGQWVLESGKERIVAAIAAEAAISSKVFVVTDPDREGERIAQDVINRAKLKNFYRLSINEITKERILHGLKFECREINNQINEAQKARRLIDREIGYPISQLLRADFKRTQSVFTPKGAGRVISPALHIICEAEVRIDNFTPETYYQIINYYTAGGEQFYAMCKTKFLETQNEELQHALGLVERNAHIIADYKRVNAEISPPPPLITSQLQHSAFYLHDFLPPETMKLAQELFDYGYITYPRSDSYHINDDAARDIIQVVHEHFGPENTLNIKRGFTDPPRAQQGHEAIRPTSFSEERFPSNISKVWAKNGDNLGEKHLNLYNFIFFRTIATQMKNSIYDTTFCVIQVNEMRFEARANKLLFAGWEELGKKNILGVEIDEWKDREVSLPRLTIGDPLEPLTIDTVERTTRRPDRYGVGRFITTLDHAGIARPSTIAGIVSSLKNKDYVDIRNGMLYPTEMGRAVDEWICRNCPWLADPLNAKEFEDRLDEIELGITLNADSFIYEYYLKVEELKKALQLEVHGKFQPSEKQVEYARKLAEKAGSELPKDILTDGKKLNSFIQKNQAQSLGKCPACKKGKISDRGEFYGCSDFQIGCKFSMNKKNVLRFLQQFHVPYDDEGQAIIKAAGTMKPLSFDKLKSKKGFFSAKIIFKKDEQWGWQLGLEFNRK